MDLSQSQAMNSATSQIDICAVEVDLVDRWLVYQRLLELDISCECALNQPLKVGISSVTTAIQLWSVVRCLSAPRRKLIYDLERCWKAKL